MTRGARPNSFLSHRSGRLSKPTHRDDVGRASYRVRRWRESTTELCKGHEHSVDASGREPGTYESTNETQLVGLSRTPAWVAGVRTVVSELFLDTEPSASLAVTPYSD